MNEPRKTGDRATTETTPAERCGASWETAWGDRRFAGSTPTARLRSARRVPEGPGAASRRSGRSRAPQPRERRPSSTLAFGREYSLAHPRPRRAARRIFFQLEQPLIECLLDRAAERRRRDRFGERFPELAQKVEFFGDR